MPNPDARPDRVKPTRSTDPRENPLDALELVVLRQPKLNLGQVVMTVNALDELLKALGGDSDENFLKIYSVESYSGTALPDLDAATIEDEPLQIFYGDHAYEVRKAAAYELFELYYPELYKMYDECNCDGLKFDIEAFLSMPCFCVEEVKFGNRAVLLVSSR